MIILRFCKLDATFQYLNKKSDAQQPSNVVSSYFSLILPLWCRYLVSFLVCGRIYLEISLVRCNKWLRIKVDVHFIYSTAPIIYIHTGIIRHCCVVLCKSFLSVYILVNVYLLIVHYQLFLCCMSVIVYLSFLIVVHEYG